MAPRGLRRLSVSAASVSLVAAAAAVAVLALAGRAAAWGDAGHQITAAVAQQLLNPGVASKVKTILDGSTLEDVATWADQMKRVSGYTWSAELHYINTPDWACDFEPDRDCANNVCVYGAILNYTQRLHTQHTEQRQEALKFMTHFFGDIHQPLHAGFGSDRGGNSIKGRFENAENDLHMVWDKPLVLLQISRTYGSVEAFANYLVSQLQGPWAGNATVTGACSDPSTTVCPQEWGNESAALACGFSYVDQDGNKIQNGFTLGDPYFDFTKDVVAMQLARGGYRLATVLNDILAVKEGDAEFGQF